MSEPKEFHPGTSGTLTRTFINSPLTPLLLLASILVGLIALQALPREESRRRLGTLRSRPAPSVCDGAAVNGPCQIIVMDGLTQSIGACKMGQKPKAGRCTRRRPDLYLALIKGLAGPSWIVTPLTQSHLQCPPRGALRYRSPWASWPLRLRASLN
jgi:hypothetical protein